MNLYLDGMFYRCSGVGRVIENLLGALLAGGPFDRIHTLVPASHREAFTRQFGDPRVRPVFVPHAPMGPWDLFRKSSALRAVADDVSLFLFPSHNAPVGVPGRSVVTVNDVTVFSPHSAYRWHQKAVFRAVLSRTLRQAEAVVTISHASKDAIEREFPGSAARTAVFYPWIEEKFFRDIRTPLPGRAPVEGDYLLYLGLRIAHKNPEGAVRAFLLLADAFPGLRMVVAGGRAREEDAVDRLKGDPRLAGRLVEIGSPSDVEILHLYAGAGAFVFPSFSEGFGLPPLEAMAAGVPVVCSDIPVFREVYGDAARFVDPECPESIAEGVRGVLSDAVLRETLVRKGRERAYRFRRPEGGVGDYLEWLRGLCGT